MFRIPLVVAFSAAITSAQDADRSPFQIPGTETHVKFVTVDGQTRSHMSRDGGRTWVRQSVLDEMLHIRAGDFDPRTPPVFGGALRAGPRNRLFIVQFRSQIIREFRSALQAAGAEIHHYLPSQSYLVRMDGELLGKVSAMPFVRTVLPYHVGFRLEPEILASLARPEGAPVRYTIVMVDKRRDAASVLAACRAAGARIDVAPDGGILFDATMNRAQLQQLAADDHVLWIERWSAPEEDIDLARIQGGTNYVEGLAGVDGKGIYGHVCEGVYATHPEFAARPPYRTTPLGVGLATAQNHGNATAGEIYGRGARSGYKGLMPFAQMSYTNYAFLTQNNGSRYALTQQLVDPSQRYKAMVQTASWGYSRTLSYTARSAEMDDIIFDLDLFVTQSQSNAGGTSQPRNSRPQAWAKNITSVGGFRHGNNTNPGDDYWGRSGSTGPAADGRIGVTLAAYYDSIQTTGYGATAYMASFGGTSGATPIVNGLGGNMVEMFTRGFFGYNGDPGWSGRYLNTPHFTTTKALLIATASQVTYDASGRTTGANRYQQGWGMPNVRTAYDNRHTMLVIDELDVLRQGQSRTYFLMSSGGAFHAAMNYADPAAVVGAGIHRVNSVDLAVRFGAGGSYKGNNGLLSGPSSVPGGAANDRDTEECVILPRAPSGLVAVTVSATGVRRDGHVETRAMDVDYGLAVRGVRGLRDRSGMRLTAATSPGQLRMSLTGLPRGWAAGYTLFSLDTRRPVSTGDVLGVEQDALLYSGLRQRPSVGNVFAFRPTTAAVYPNAPFEFPTGIVNAIRGLTIDSVALVIGTQSQLLDVSNVERFKVQ